MERPGIDKLEELITLAANPLPEVNTPVAVIPGSCAVVDMEKYLAAPMAFRGTMDTGRISSLMEYIDNHKSASSAVFIGEDMTVKFIADHGNEDNPGWGRHQAILSLGKMADYRELLEKNLVKFGQKSMVDFIRDHEHCLTFYQDPDMVSVMSSHNAIKSIQRIDITNMLKTGQEEGDTHRRRSVLEEVEVSSDIKPPALMVMTCSPYAEFNEISIVCRVVVYMNSDDLKLAFRIQAIEKVEESLIQEFYNTIINDPVMSNVSAYIGYFSR